MKPLRVLIIVEAKTITGPAKNLLEFVRRVRQTQDSPPIEVMITLFQRGDASKLFVETARRASIPIFPIAERYRFDRTVLSKLSDLVEELKPDLIQSTGAKSHFLVRWAGLHRTTPWIAFHHGYTWPDLRMRLYNQLDRWSLRGAHRVVTVSLAFQRELVHRGVAPDRIEVLHNSIDPNWAASSRSPEVAGALRAKLAIGRDKKLILIVGRLSKEKDHLTLLRAVHHLRTATSLSPDAGPHVLIVGDGVERQRIDQAIRTWGLTDAVTCVGQVPSAEPYYGIADLCVLSSLSEGSPNALLEAMAAHVPVVATSVGGIPEIVSHDESAWLVQPGDDQGMANAIVTLLTQKERASKLAARAYQLVLTRHTPDAYRQRLQQIYGAALANVGEGAGVSRIQDT